LLDGERETSSLLISIPLLHDDDRTDAAFNAYTMQVTGKLMTSGPFLQDILKQLDRTSLTVRITYDSESNSIKFTFDTGHETTEVLVNAANANVIVELLGAATINYDSKPFIEVKSILPFASKAALRLSVDGLLSLQVLTKHGDETIFTEILVCLFRSFSAASPV
jgi:hypothetical protein